VMLVKKNDSLDERFGLFFFLSLVAHGLFFCLILFLPVWIKPSLPALVSPMLVDLVAPMPETAGTLPERTPDPLPPRPKTPSPVESQAPPPPVPQKTPLAEKVPLPVKAEAAPVVSEKPAPAPIPAKRPLASQRTRSPAEEVNRDVVASALSDIARRVEEDRSSAIRDALRGLETEVQTRPRSVGTAEGTRQGGAAAGRALDLYISQAAHRVQQNWAYAGQGRAREGAVVVFYITRDGRVRDLVLQQSSGNRLIDDSARRAILKSEPFPPVPDAIPAERIGMGLRFTDKGVDL